MRRNKANVHTIDSSHTPPQERNNWDVLKIQYSHSVTRLYLSGGEGELSWRGLTHPLQKVADPPPIKLLKTLVGGCSETSGISGTIQMQTK